MKALILRAFRRVMVRKMDSIDEEAKRRICELEKRLYVAVKERDAACAQVRRYQNDSTYIDIDDIFIYSSYLH